LVLQKRRERHLVGVTDDLAALRDAELMRASRRNPEAFRHVYRRHHRLVYARLLREVGDPDTAAELTAETFAQAWFARRRFHDEAAGSAAPWLLGIASNLARAYRRRLTIERRALRRLGLGEAVIDDGFVEVDERDAAERSRIWIQAGLEALPESQREAVRLHVLEGLSYATIADRHGCTAALVRLRVSRGLRTLRRAAPNETRTA
jgi:RNA polymerase sigma factor (sigma-70 family)